MYPCIIKAGPLRVINTLQKSSNMLDLPLSLSLSLKLVTVANFNQMHAHEWRSASVCVCMCTCLQAHQQILHVLHMHACCTCLSNSAALRKAIHEQQALLTTLAPLHWQAKNIREEDTHTHTHTHTHIHSCSHRQRWWAERTGEEEGRRKKRTETLQYKANRGQETL